jgi:hypothetical protein
VDHRKNAIKTRLVYRTKRDSKGNVLRYKQDLFAKVSHRSMDTITTKCLLQLQMSCQLDLYLQLLLETVTCKDCISSSQLRGRHLYCYPR